MLASISEECLDKFPEKVEHLGELKPRLDLLAQTALCKLSCAWGQLGSASRLYSLTRHSLKLSDGEKDWAWQMEQDQTFSLYDNTTENILRPAGPEAAFEGVRPVVDEDGFPDFDQVPEQLPSFEVIRNNSDVPGVPTTTGVR